jgi:hypothetical protein
VHVLYAKVAETHLVAAKRYHVLTNPVKSPVSHCDWRGFLLP